MAQRKPIKQHIKEKGAGAIALTTLLSFFGEKGYKEIFNKKDPEIIRLEQKFDLYVKFQQQKDSMAAKYYDAMILNLKEINK